MKKLLVASTALISIAAVSSAQAADPIKLSLGGSMNQWVSYADNENDNGARNYAEIATFSDAEVHFSGSTKLDNGLTIGVTMELESSGNPDSARAYGSNDYESGTFDDTFLSITSDTLGTVRIGSTKGAGYGMANTHADVGIGLSDGDHEVFVVNALDHDLDTTTSSADGHKVVYLTPNLGGVQAAVSYGLVPQANTGRVDLQTSGNDIQYNAAVAYSGNYDGLTIGADVAYEMVESGGLTGGGTASTATDGTATDSIDQISNYETWRAGLSVGVAGFTFGGSYQDRENEGGVTDKDSEAWELGVAYATGPYGVSLGYLQTTYEDDGTSAAQEDETQVWVLSGSYNLGAGVSLAGSVFNIDSDDADSTGPNSTTDNNNWGVAAGLQVSF